MKIKIASVMVDDQEKALKFYTDILGFVKKTDVFAGEYRWLTVVSPEGSDDVELLLEPNANPAARTYQDAIYKQGIPHTMFFVDDLQKEFERLSNSGVKFVIAPTKQDWGSYAVFDDTCGNLINISQL